MRMVGEEGRMRHLALALGLGLAVGVALSFVYLARGASEAVALQSATAPERAPEADL